MKKYLFFYFLLYTIKKSLFKKSFKYNSLPSVTACITNKHLHGPTRGSTWIADTSRAPAEHFRCLFKTILTSFLHWGEKQNAGLQRDKTRCCKVQQRICPPHERFTKTMGIPIAEGQHWHKPITVLSGHCPPCPAVWEVSRMALYNPPELLLASEGKRCYTKWCQKFRNCSMRKTSIRFFFK